MGIKRCMDSLEKVSFHCLMSIVAISSILRTLIEWLGRSENTFVYAIPSKGAGFLNSYTWILYIVFINAITIQYFLDNDRSRFRRLFSISVLSVCPVIVLDGIINVGFSYHFIRLPVWYNIKYLIFPTYMPAGCAFSFLFFFITAPFALKKWVYRETSLLMITLVVWFSILITFLFGYQIALWIPYFLFHVLFEGSRLIPFFKPHFSIPPLPTIFNVMFEAFLFLFPVVLFYPMFIRNYACTEREASHLKIYLAFFIGLLFITFFLSMITMDECIILLKHL